MQSKVVSGFRFVLPVLLLVGFLVVPVSSALAAISVTAVTLNGSTGTITVGGNATITVSATVNTNGSDDWSSTGWLASITPPGTLNCANTPDHIESGNNTYTESFNITGPATSGTYN